jgi:hypothetical protein
MKPNHARRRTGGFTGWDLLICVVTATLVIGFLLMQRSTGCGAKASRINCVSNLKQIGAAFHSWSYDNGGAFPWNVSMTNGGTLELISSGKAFPHFRAISNGVSTPKVFVCSTDSSRKRAQWWDWFVGDTNVSYFVGLDCSETYPQSIVTGDRNLSTNSKQMSGLVLIASNTPMTWAPGLHAPAGNVGLADGSAMSAMSVLAQRANDTDQASRFIFP